MKIYRRQSRAYKYTTINYSDGSLNYVKNRTNEVLIIFDDTHLHFIIQSKLKAT